MDNKDNAIEIEKINKALSEINFFELDNSIVSFYKSNINYYCENANSIEVLDNNCCGLILKKDDNSTFSVECIPSYVSPEKVIIRLVNLNGQNVKVYSMSFGIDEIVVTKRSKLVNNDSENIKIHKVNSKTKYISQKKAYEKKIETFVNANDFNEYSKQEEIFYPELTPLYYKSVITIASEDTYNIKPVSYVKGYGIISTKEIDEIEFKNGIMKKQNKVLKKKYEGKKA